MAKRIAARLRLQAYRRLHPRRHAMVKERLRGAARPRTIVAVCQGNVCRSPYLEAVLRRALPDVDVSSAGFTIPGRPMPQNGIQIAARHGLDLSSHRSRLISGEILRRADLVIVMDERQERSVTRDFGIPGARVIVAGDLDREAGESREILDPWRHGLDVFESSYARLDRCAATLADAVPARGAKP